MTQASNASTRNPSSHSSFDQPEKPWSVDINEVRKALQVDIEAGLSEEQASRRLKSCGPNRLKESKPRSMWQILIDQFASLIVGLLGVAAITAVVFGRWVEGVAIAIALVINAVIGFFTELKATRSMEALHRLGSTEAKVYRQGQIKVLPAPKIVPGDLVSLEAGDLVPADLRVSEANNLQVDEAALTGESLPITKQVEAVSTEASLAERTSMLYKGTAVTSGSGAGVAVATGMQTELGRIATLAEDVGEKFTPLERRLERLGRRLVWATLAVGILVTVAGLIGGKHWLLVLETAIAMAVAAVPEGLPIVATIALARGMWRMAHRNALINRLSAVETLGATNIICTDKTGTLTENRMHLQRLELASGTFALDEEDFDLQKHDLLRRVLETGVLCNNSSLDQEGGDAVGDPLEVALLKAAAAHDLHRDQLLGQLPEVREEAFDPDTLMMATFHQSEESYRIAVKGAPEAVLDSCSAIAEKEGDVELSDALRQDWQERNQQLAKNGFRVLALADKAGNSAEDDPYQGLTLLGLAGLWDPPRKEISDTLEQCRQAGIRVIMVTGDHPATALAVAHAVGLNGDSSTVMTGDDLKKPEDLTEEQRRKLLKASIFARVSPEQKLHLINLHQGTGAIVAMTGDGVNDAPALQQADIGVAMGKRGTQVAREAADMVLQDDRFATIITAIYHGRVIFSNIRKFIFFLLSGNVSEILIITLAALVNAPLPLLPLQILYLNLIGDVFPALALGVGEGDRSVMQQPPRDPDEPVLPRGYWLAIIGYAVVIATVVLCGFAMAIIYFGMARDQAVTVSFLSLSLARLCHVFNMRDRESGLFCNEITRNPFIWGALVFCLGLLAIALYLPGLREILSLTAPGAAGWGIILVVGVLPLLVGQAAKLVMTTFDRQENDHQPTIHLQR
ncbi:MAG: cation-transporting P-type ATPase [Desulfuromonadales bacterium]|nr:cation-transporting P-type ATPase [Desulfuromonadales bacterium]